MRAKFVHGRCKMQVDSFTQILILNGLWARKTSKGHIQSRARLIPGTLSDASLLKVGSLEKNADDSSVEIRAVVHRRKGARPLWVPHWNTLGI